MRYLVGNWKSHQTISQTHYWFEEFARTSAPQSGLQIIICLPFTDLAEANRHIVHLGLNLKLGAQDVSRFDEGKHTGEVTASMLSELVSFCLVGHSERRREEGETVDAVAQKAARLLERSITPIVCVDTPYMDDQIRELLKLRIKVEDCLFAYEPASSIGNGNAEDPSLVTKVIAKLNFLTGGSSLLYGGSVSGDNANMYLGLSGISGVLVGRESLSVSQFTNIARAFI